MQNHLVIVSSEESRQHDKLYVPKINGQDST